MYVCMYVYHTIFPALPIIGKGDSTLVARVGDRGTLAYLYNKYL